MTKTKTAVKIVCPHCGSESISKDASAHWNDKTQEWELSGTQDFEICDDCGAQGDCFADRRPIDASGAPALQSGQVDLGNKVVFRWMIQGETTPEIYGWLERDFAIVQGSGGFWRTADPDEALRRVKAAFSAELA